jgi:hypothetical protein
MNKERIEALKTAPSSSGKVQLLKYLEGDRLSASQSIKAKCCDCMGDFIDGRNDCEIEDCPLYPLQPYKKNKTEKIKGSKTLSEEHIRKLVEGRKNKKENKI